MIGHNRVYTGPGLDKELIIVRNNLKHLHSLEYNSNNGPIMKALHETLNEFVIDNSVYQWHHEIFHLLSLNEI